MVLNFCRMEQVSVLQKKINVIKEITLCFNFCMYLMIVSSFTVLTKVVNRCDINNNVLFFEC